MLRKLLKIIVVVLMIIGIYYGISITVKRKLPRNDRKLAESNFINMLQAKPAELTAFYTYGRAFNVIGKISNINKDNFESVRLLITDGLDYEESYSLSCDFEDGNLIFYSNNEINSGIIIDKLENKEYYICLKLKLNNSVNYKYYSFTNASEYDNIDYYTLTKDGQNRIAKLVFSEKEVDSKKYNYMSIKVEDGELPEEIYDIVIDAGNGGRDPGETLGAVREADINLEYAKMLKESLEEHGYKVKLTRDDENTDTYTYNNMYNPDGRISIACKTRAKLMISFQINNGEKYLKGLEVCAPSRSNLNFANALATRIKENTDIEYSNNTAHKVQDGVYVKNYTKQEIKEAENTAKRKGYEPYNITTDTPYFYTIREVGGIAMNAYVDGRNKDYLKNEFYKSNHGIECYQIELGYIKNDLEIITNEKENYIQAITDTITKDY